MRGVSEPWPYIQEERRMSSWENFKETAGPLAGVALVVVVVVLGGKTLYELDRDLDSLKDRAQIAANASDMRAYMEQLEANMRRHRAISGHTAFLFRNARTDLALQHQGVNRVIERLREIEQLPPATQAAGLDDIRGVLREMPSLAFGVAWTTLGGLRPLVPTVEASRQETTTAVKPDDDGVGKRASKLTTEIEKERKQSPAGFEKMRTAMTLLAEMHLGRLGFEPGPLDGVSDDKLRGTVQDFERARGLPVTGDPVSDRTLATLMAENELLDHHSVALPFRHFGDSMWKEGFASATGTWAFQNGEKMGWPEQASEIDCFRDRGECVEALAVVTDGDTKTHALSVDLNYYDIERWDEHEIVTKPLERTCVRYVMRFNRVQKSVTAVRSTISKEGTCEGMSGELYVVLSDGFKASLSRQTAESEERKRLMNVRPEVWQRLKAEPAR
jgi:hypothetical protein